MLEGKKGVAVMDRAISIGAQGPIFPEVRSALYDVRSTARDRPTTSTAWAAGTSAEELKHVFKQLIHKEGETVNYLGVRK